MPSATSAESMAQISATPSAPPDQRSKTPDELPASCEAGGEAVATRVVKIMKQNEPLVSFLMPVTRSFISGVISVTLTVSMNF